MWTRHRYKEPLEGAGMLLAAIAGSLIFIWIAGHGIDALIRYNNRLYAEKQERTTTMNHVYNPDIRRMIKLERAYRNTQTNKDCSEAVWIDPNDIKSFVQVDKTSVPLGQGLTNVLLNGGVNVIGIRETPEEIMGLAASKLH